MIRSFDLRDLALIHRLSEQGVLLQAEVALTSSPHPLRSALAHLLLGGQYATYVWKSGESNAAAFAQLDWDSRLPSAHVVCLGAEAGHDPEVIDETIWLPFLEQLVVEAGRKGVHNLVAEVSETGPELPLLRRAGFAVYTRQDIWRCDEPPGRQPQVALRAPEPVDELDIQLLYVNIVPRLIQMVEPNPPTEPDHSWVLREDGELVAFVHINDGAVADWMRLWIHPNAQVQADAIIEAALLLKPPTPRHPIYCSVRRYQSWLRGPLEQAGFGLWGSQAVMVKHIVQTADVAEARASTQAAQPTLLEPQTFLHPAPASRPSHSLVHDGPIA